MIGAVADENSIMRRTRSPTLVLVSLAALIALPSQALAAGSGGIGPGGSPTGTVPGSTAKLVDGTAIPPADASPRVSRAIEAAKAARATLLGFTDDPSRIVRAAPAIQGTSQVARIPLYWTGVRLSGWGEIDLAVNAARASGQRLLITVTGLAAPDLGEWDSFLRGLHARYPDLWAVQAWNESNLANIGGDLSVEQTVAIVQTARQALPGVRVIGPGVSPTMPGAGRYQAQLYRALPNSVGVGINIFTYGRKNGVADALAAYRKAKAAGGKAEVYVTELGFHGGYFPNQAAVSAQAFKALRKEGAATVIFYRMLTDPTLTANWELTGHFNVLNEDLSPTPILAALRKASR